MEGIVAALVKEEQTRFPEPVPWKFSYGTAGFRDKSVKLSGDTRTPFIKYTIEIAIEHTSLSICTCESSASESEVTCNDHESIIIYYYDIHVYTYSLEQINWIGSFFEWEFLLP